MRFLQDESADYPLAAWLKERGHNVTAIAHDYPSALKDREVLNIAYREGRILITNDRDFGELIFRQRLPNAGVILFRLGEESIEVKAMRLAEVLDHYADRLSQFIVVTERGIRIRGANR